MSGGIGAILNQARGALAASQVGMNTTAKNVSNVNTEGYSRRRVDFKSGPPDYYGRLQIGGGVEVGSITRSANDFLTRRITEENTVLGKAEGTADIYNQLEVLFKEDGDAGMAGIVSQFFNDLRTLSTQPDSTPLRAAVRESAAGVTTRFRNIVEGVDQVVADVDRRIEGEVHSINELTHRISVLNRQITEAEVRGTNVDANDDRDARDLALQKLSKIVDITVTPIENGGMNITSGRLGPLVISADPVTLAAYRDPGTGAGAMKVFMLSEIPGVKPKDVTEKIDSGALRAYIDVRDRVIPEMSGKIDELAYNLTEQINGIHKQAYSRNGDQGIEFFSNAGSVKNAARNLTLSDDIKDDLSNIATAVESNRAGDNRAVLAMADLQQAPLFENGRASFADLASGIVGTLGVQAKTAYDNLNTQKGLVEQLDTFQKEVSAVSLDEEAMGMLKFQKAFDASAKMIQLADSMMETVINLKRF